MSRTILYGHDISRLMRDAREAIAVMRSVNDLVYAALFSGSLEARDCTNLDLAASRLERSLRAIDASFPPVTVEVVGALTDGEPA